MNKTVIIATLGILNLGGLWLAVSQYPRNIQDNASVIKANKSAMLNYKHNTKDLTVVKYEKVLRRQVNNLNLDDVENELANNLKDGITKAYSLQTTEDYTKNADEIRNKLGASLADTVFEKTAPTYSETDNKSYARIGKFNNVNVSFGDLDIHQKTLPVIVEVDYDVPENQTDTEGDSTNRKVIYTFKYDVSKKTQSDVKTENLVQSANKG